METVYPIDLVAILNIKWKTYRLCSCYVGRYRTRRPHTRHGRDGRGRPTRVRPSSRESSVSRGRVYLHFLRRGTLASPVVHSVRHTRVVAHPWHDPLRVVSYTTAIIIWHTQSLPGLSLCHFRGPPHTPTNQPQTNNQTTFSGRKVRTFLKSVELSQWTVLTTSSFLSHPLVKVKKLFTKTQGLDTVHEKNSTLRTSLFSLFLGYQDTKWKITRMKTASLSHWRDHRDVWWTYQKRIDYPRGLITNH